MNRNARGRELDPSVWISVWQTRLVEIFRS